MAEMGKYWVDEENGQLVFQDEEGEDRFVIEDEIYLDDHKYIILIPADLVDDEEEEAYIMKVIQKDDQEILSVIEDDNEFERVKEAYLGLLD